MYKRSGRHQLFHQRFLWISWAALNLLVDDNGDLCVLVCQTLRWGCWGFGTSLARLLWTASSWKRLASTLCTSSTPLWSRKVKPRMKYLLFPCWFPDTVKAVSGIFSPFPPQLRAQVLPVKASIPVPPVKQCLLQPCARTGPSLFHLVTLCAASWMEEWDFMTWERKSGTSYETW